MNEPTTMSYHLSVGHCVATHPCTTAPEDNESTWTVANFTGA